MSDQVWAWLVMTFGGGLKVLAEVLVEDLASLRPVVDAGKFIRLRKLLHCVVIPGNPRAPDPIDRLEFEPSLELRFKAVAEDAEYCFRADTLMFHVAASNRAIEEADRVLNRRPKLVAVSGNGRAQKILDDPRGGGGA
jgi:hypothetical protein